MKKPFCFSISDGPPQVSLERQRHRSYQATMDVTNLLIISLLLLEEEALHNKENQRRRERWAAMSQVEREERN